ncbi:MAG: hypothetical protein QUS35_11945 [bacterium]|nr:hypothetical protein [bacterium]
MFHLSMVNDLLYPRAVLMGILFLGLCCLIGLAWSAFRNAPRFRRVFPILAGFSAAACFSLFLFAFPPDHDEIEHISAAWHVSQGLLPYNDFFQHHSPMLYILYAPLFRIPAVASHPAESARLLSGLISLGILGLLIRMAKTVWKDNLAAWPVTVLFLGNFLNLQLFNMRPDLPAVLCNLAGLWILLRRGTVPDFGLAGLLLGLGLSFSPKYAPFLLLAPAWMILDRQGWKPALRRIAAHAAGIAAGLAPLFLWLSANGLLGLFRLWVFGFNAHRITTGASVFGGSVQAIPAFFCAWGCLRLLRSVREPDRAAGRLLAVFAALSALVYLKPARTHYEYYQQMFVLTALVAAAGPLASLTRKWSRDRRAVLPALLAGVILWGGVHTAQRYVRLGLYGEVAGSIRTLKTLAGDDPVICTTPEHPVTNRNASYISTGWQYVFCLGDPLIRGRLAGIGADIRNRKPSVIINRFLVWPEGGDFTERLRRRGVLPDDEAADLRRYLESRYTLVPVRQIEYWVRNDRVRAAARNERR